MACWANKVQACVHTEINLVCSAWLLLLQHVALMLIIQEFYDWLPAVPVVHVVTETRRIDDGETDFEELLLQLSLGDLDLDGLVNLLGVTVLPENNLAFCRLSTLGLLLLFGPGTSFGQTSCAFPPCRSIGTSRGTNHNVY